MGDTKLSKHYSDFDSYLKKAKKEFESRWTAEFRQNSEVSDFTIVKTLGMGSFGRVVLVRHVKKQENVYAMKLLEKQYIVKHKQVTHTHSEIRIMDAMRFEFLVHLEYFTKDNVYIYLGMPFVNGGEMFTHLRRLKRFDETLAKFYAAQVILAFEYMHYIGVVYRDLKPENILLDRDGYLKITDFGFCKRIGDERTYSLCGTPEYLAPEIIMSQGYNKSVDWWSLGVLIYEMNAGFPPFFAKDPMKIYEKIVSGKYSFPAHFSKALKDLTTNILQVDRSKRFGILKNGSKDLKGHEWFRSIDWDQLLGRKMKPMYKPRVGADVGDATNFDLFEEAPIRSSPVNEHEQEFAYIHCTSKQT